jgi:hypothetical protein
MKYLLNISLCQIGIASALQLAVENDAMDLVLYSAVESTNQGRLLVQVETVVRRECVVICQTVQELFRSLLRPLSDLLAVVLLIRDLRELLLILSLQETLHATRVILILPNLEPVTTTSGHSLRPRFLTHADSDFREVAAVLHKMMPRACRSLS